MIKELKMLLGLAVMGLAAHAQELPFDPSVRTGKLANGFTYFIRKNNEPGDKVVFYLANKAGSILENDDQRGLAHFLEHMSFNGTKNFPKNALIDYLQKSGVRFGADINAYTNFDETVYQLPLPSNDPSILANGVQILRDWASEATLDASELDKERGVVLEEKRLGKGVSQRMREKYFPLLLNGSRYAYRLPIGDEQILSNFKPDAIRNFYKDWYRPNLQAIIVVGDIDVDRMESTIKEKFSDLKNPLPERERTAYKIELSGKNQFLELTDPEMTAVNLQMISKFYSHKVSTVAGYKMAATTNILNLMLARRLQELSQRPNPDFLQASASIGPLLGGLDGFTLSINAKEGKSGLELAFKQVYREIVRIKKNGFTQQELDRTKKEMVARIESAYTEKDKKSSEAYVKEYLQTFLKGEASPGIEYEYGLFKSTLSQITLADVNRSIQRNLIGFNRDILIQAPETEKGNLPGDSLVNGWISSLEQEIPVQYVEKKNILPLLDRWPEKGTILSQSTDPKYGVTTLVFANGTKAVLKPTAFKNNEVIFSAAQRGGVLIYPKKDYQSAIIASSIIPAFGAGNLSGTELQRFMTGKQIGVRTSISLRSQGLSAGATKTDLESALQLMYAYLTAPRKDSAMFRTLVQRAKAGLANRANDPSSVFQDTVSAVLGNYDERRTGPSVAKIDQVDLNRSYEIFKERFSNANGMTYVLVGSFNIDSIKPLLLQYIGSLPSGKSLQEPSEELFEMPKGHIEKTVFKGKEPKASVQLIFSGDFDYNPSSNVALAAIKEILQIRLLERLREEESGVYSPSVRVGSNKLPKARYNLGITFGCSPENVDKLIASALDEIEKIKSQGPLQVNLDKFRAEENRQHESSVKTNSFWLGYISSCLENGEKLDTMESYNAAVDSLTVEQVRQAAKKYLGGENFIRFVLKPENASK